MSAQTLLPMPQPERSYKTWRKKGNLILENDSPRFIHPSQPGNKTGHFALKQVVQNFFDKSIEKSSAALDSDPEVYDEEFDRMSRVIEQPKKGG